jgi:hypothetical protein
MTAEITGRKVPMQSAMRVPIVVVLSAALCACGSRGNSSDPTPRPSLAGSWVLNAEESEEPVEQLADGRGGGGGRTPAGGRGRTGGGGRGGMGGGGRGGMGRGDDTGGMQERAAQIRAVIQSLTEGRRRIALKQSDSTVLLTYGDGTPIESLTDGKEREKAVGGMGRIKVKAEWQDGWLIVERKLEGGIKVREEFMRAPDSPRLITTTIITGLPRDLKFRSVYDRSSGSRGAIPNA